MAVALGSLAQQQPGKRAADVWMGVARTDEGQRQLTVTWEPVDPAPPTPAAVVDFEFALGGKPAAAARRVAPAKSGTTEGARAVFDLEPGAVAVTVVAKAADGSILDRWTQQAEVPDAAAVGPGDGDAAPVPRAHAAGVPRHPGRGRPHAGRVAPVQPHRPRAGRRAVPRRRSPATPSTSARTCRRGKGRNWRRCPRPQLENGRVRFELPVGSLGQGTYILRLQAKVGAEAVEQNVAFRVAR